MLSNENLSLDTSVTEKVDKLVDATIENESISESDSDCEIIEQPSTVIVLDDDLDLDTSSNRGESNDITDKKSLEESFVSKIESPLMFYEDRAPNTKVTIPIYETSQSIGTVEAVNILDNSLSITEDHNLSDKISNSVAMNNISEASPSNYLAPLLSSTPLPTKQMESNNQQNSILSISETSENVILFDNNQNVPKTKMLISVQAAADSVTTRTSTITSINTQKISPNQTKSNDRTIVQMKNTVHDLQTPSVQITISNDFNGSRSVSNGYLKRRSSELEVSDSSQKKTKRSRIDQDVILIDESSNDFRSMKDDSVVFVSETIHSNRSLPVSRKRKLDDDFISINNGSTNAKVRLLFLNLCLKID